MSIEVLFSGVWSDVLLCACFKSVKKKKKNLNFPCIAHKNVKIHIKNVFYFYT